MYFQVLYAPELHSFIALRIEVLYAQLDLIRKTEVAKLRPLNFYSASLLLAALPVGTAKDSTLFSTLIV